MDKYDPRGCVIDVRRTVANGVLGVQARTKSSKVYYAGEGDGPGVHGVYNIATVELKEQPVLDIWATRPGRRFTKRPSASQLFKRNITVETTPAALL